MSPAGLHVVRVARWGRRGLLCCCAHLHAPIALHAAGAAPFSFFSICKELLCCARCVLWCGVGVCAAGKDLTYNFLVFDAKKQHLCVVSIGSEVRSRVHTDSHLLCMWREC